jgi:colanic acid/amylovoran biosynthesis glycosyltransferase
MNARGPGPGRALHAIWGFGAASETFIVDRMVELDRLGWEAWVAAKWIVDAPVYEFPPPERVVSPRPRDELARRLRRPLGPTPPWWWLRRPIAKLDPVLIHAHFGWTAREALGAAERYRIPLVAGFHGYDATVYPRYGFDAHEEAPAPSMPDDLYAELFARADGILATSEFIAAKLRELGCEREIDVVPSGTRLDCFPYRGPRPGAGVEELRVLFVGRLVPYKGLDVTIEALAELAGGEGPRARLTAVGEGPARSELEALASSHGLEGSVEFRGRQPRSVVLEELNRADVLVLPSRTTPAGQAEGLGNVVKEALAVGLEVAVSDNGGIAETLPPERRDEQVAEGDATALALRLEAIAALPAAERERRARRGRAWVEEAFDWRRLSPRIAAVYQRALAGH